MRHADPPVHPSSTPLHPLRALLASFPVVCFTLTLLTDIAFWQTSNLMWQNFSSWLLFAGLVFGGLALLVGIVGAVYRMAVGGDGPRWLPALAALIVLALAFVNSLVHAGDGWTAVVPTGLALSAATVLLMLVAAALGRWPARRGTVGVAHYA